MKLFNLSNRGNRCSVPANVRALQLLVWLVVALMLPNIVLAFTEGYNGWSVAAGIILPLGLYLLTPLFTRRVSFVALVLLPVLALCAVQIVLLYLYGNSIIAVDMYTNIMTTNSVESSELLRGMTPVIIGVALLYVPLLYAVLRQIIDSRYSLSGSVRRGFVMAGALLTIVGIQLLYPATLSTICVLHFIIVGLLSATPRPRQSIVTRPREQCPLPNARSISTLSVIHRVLAAGAFMVINASPIPDSRHVRISAYSKISSHKATPLTRACH